MKNYSLYILVIGLVLIVLGAYMFTSDSRKMYTSQEFNGDVLSLNWSSNGEYLAVGARSELVIWNTQTKLISNSEKISTGEMNLIVWNPNSTQLASHIAQSSKIIIYSITNFPSKVTLNANNTVNCISWSPDGKFLATGLSNGFIIIWNTKNWSVQSQIQAGAESITALNWNLNDTVLITGTVSGTIQFFNQSDFSLINSFTIHNSSICSIDSISSTDLIVAYTDGTVLIYNTQQKEVLNEIKIAYSIQQLILNPKKDEFMLKFYENVNFVEIFTFNSLKINQFTKIRDSMVIMSSCWSSSGNIVVIGDGLNRFYFINPNKPSNSSILDLSAQYIVGLVSFFIGLLVSIIELYKIKNNELQAFKLKTQLLRSDNFVFKQESKFIVSILGLASLIVVNLFFNNIILASFLFLIAVILYYIFDINHNNSEEIQEIELYIQEKSFILGFKISLAIIFIFIAAYLVNLLLDLKMHIQLTFLPLINFFLLVFLIIEILKLYYSKIYQ